jgi:HEPN domain-containing protein
MKKIAKRWINFAKRDLRDAEILFTNKRYSVVFIIVTKPLKNF